MNKKIAILLFICGAFFLNACQKNTDIFVPDPGQLNGPDTTWSSTIPSTAPVVDLQAALVTSPVNDSVEVNTAAVTLTETNGLQCTFPPLCFVTSAGVPVTGRVYLEIRLIKTKGEMILLNKPTASNGSMLVSGGEIFISASKNGQPVQLAPNSKIYFSYPDTPLYPQMKLFLGDETNPAQINWKPSTSSADIVVAGSQAYEISTSHLRWINCDYFYDTTGITSSVVNASLPTNYTNNNTTTFLVFKDFRTVLGMYGDVPQRRFVSGKVPNGKAAVVVAISKQGNDYFLGKENITIGVNATTSNVQTVTVTPVKASLADIRAYLATL